VVVYHRFVEKSLAARVCASIPEGSSMATYDTDSNQGQQGAIPRGRNLDSQVSGATPSSTPTITGTSTYQRPPRVHVTQGAIDDLAVDEVQSDYVHESSYVTGSKALGDRAYRRSSKDIQAMQKGSPYGQYLSVPKGRKQIFASQERKRRIKSVLALILVLAVLAAAVYFIWQVMQGLPLIGSN